ncbi:MAG: hypothetical protein KDB27_31490 [Planctomycetales bacterium]|nr:hypothetical protein [Planctomycetales bacterium]
MPRTFSASDYEIRLSTIQQTVGSLSNTFASNVGTDEKTVYTGPTTITTGNLGPPEGPKEFDIIFRFQRPFYYEPSRGNLLLEQIRGRGNNFIGFDHHTALGSSLLGAVSSSSQSAVGRLNGTVTKLFFRSSLSGDFDLNDVVDVEDIDALMSAIRDASDDLVFDVDTSGTVNRSDLDALVVQTLNTWFGDADLNGEFNSGDLVAVFTASEYEDGVSNNSTWGTGDWNGDGEFDSGDLGVAFQDGGYEKGTRTEAQVVPEPSSVFVLLLSLVGLQCHFRNRQTRV